MASVDGKISHFKRRIIDEIASGVWHEDDRFLSERDLCERHQVSRTTVRLAMQDLIAEGLLVRQGRSSAFIGHNAAQIATSLQDTAHAVMTVLWLIDPADSANPLRQTIFNTCADYLDEGIQMKVCFAGGSAHLPLADPPPGDVAIVCNRPDTATLDRLRRAYKEVVHLNAVTESGHYLSPDHLGGGRIMAEYALRHGHRQIGCLANSTAQESSDFGQRCRGIQSVFDEAGIELATMALQSHYYIELPAHCHYALDVLMQQKPALSAVLCLWDLLAFGLQATLATRGMRVPEDLSLMGFDDQYYARYTTPGLTTVKYPAEAMGIKLAEFLNAVCQGKHTELRHTIRPLLVERGSVKSLIRDVIETQASSPAGTA